MWVVAAKLAALVLVVDPTSLDSFALPKSVASGALAWILLGLVVLIVLRFGPSAVPRTPMHVLVAAYVFAVLVSSVAAENMYVAWFGHWNDLMGATFLLDMLVLYAAVAIGFRSARDWAILGGVLGVTVALTIAYGGMQLVGWDPVRWVGTTSRSFATLGNAVVLGHFLACAVAGCAAVVLFGRTLAPRARLAIAALAAAAFLLLVVNASRSALLPMLLVPLVLAAVALGRGFVLHRRQVAYGVLATLIVAGAVTLGPLGDRVRATLAGAGLQDRVLIYDSALRAIADRPFLGFGPDNFAVIYPRYRQVGSAAVLSLVSESQAHSWVLQATVTTGAAGLVVWVGCIAAAFVLLWRAAVRGGSIVAPIVLAVGTAYWAYGLTSIESIGVAWIGWLVLGGAAAHGRREPLAGGRPVPAPITAIVIAATVVAGLFGLNALAASHAAQLSQAAYNSGDGPTAVARGIEATRRDSGRAEHWNWLGLGHTQTARWRDAAAAFDEARRRAPHDVTFWANLARARLLQALNGDSSGGGREAAFAAAQAAIAVDPADPEPYHVLAQVANAFGEHAQALDAAHQAILRRRTDGDYDIAAAAAAVALGDQDRARQGLQEILRLKDSATLRIALASVAAQTAAHVDVVAEGERALALDPLLSDPAVIDMVARSYLALARPVDAERWVRHALARGQTVRATSVLRVTLAEALRDQSRIGEAVAVLDEALVNWPDNEAARALRAELAPPR